MKWPRGRVFVRRLLPWLARAVHRRKNPLEEWARSNKLSTRLDPQTIVFVDKDDTESIANFAALCHERVQDRDISFSLERRIRLYRRWLSSGQPCLMAVRDSEQRLLCASIVLPLKADAYELFCFHGLSALDIEAEQIVGPARRVAHNYLLVDMLAANRRLIKVLPYARRERLRGIGFRAVLHHIATFASMQTSPPVIICSTENLPLGGLLRRMGFDDSSRQEGKFPIFRADLGDLESFPQTVRKVFSLATRDQRRFNRKGRNAA